MDNQDNPFLPGADRTTKARRYTAFIENARLRSVIDYRLIAERGGKQGWRITALIAGD